MTTIAFDGKTLAADTMSIGYGNTINQKPFRKIQPLAVLRGDESLGYLAVAGDPSYWSVFAELLQEFGSIEDPFKDVAIKKLDSICIYRRDTRIKACEETSGLWVYQDKVYHLYLTDDHLSLYSVGDPYAIGSGREFALGAMLAGANARKAVVIASKLDINTGSGVDCIEIPKES